MHLENLNQGDYIVITRDYQQENLVQDSPWRGRMDYNGIPFMVLSWSAPFISCVCVSDPHRTVSIDCRSYSLTKVDEDYWASWKYSYPEVWREVDDLDKEPVVTQETSHLCPICREGGWVQVGFGRAKFRCVACSAECERKIC